MLIEILLSLISYLIRFFAWLLPNWQLPDNITESFKDIISGIFAWDFLFPIVEISQVLFIIITFEITLLTARSIAGIISLIRGGGRIDI